MRIPAFIFLLTVPVLAGCLGGDDSPGLSAGSIIVPEGATLNETAGGFFLEWSDVDLPAELNFTLPEGATIARAMVDTSGDRNSLWLVNAETGRRRCNTETTAAWNNNIEEARSCSGLTVVDRPGDIWQVQVAGSGIGDVRVLLEDTPLDGLAALIDTSRLSHLDHQPTETRFFTIESFDGTELFAELTLPEGEGPWPTIIAASPYNAEGPRAPSMWEYWTRDAVGRGYAALNVDVRGFGNSGGCVEVWGENEQKDQVATVEWVAAQPWSDGNVGFYGQSYVATTPVAAAVDAPDALKAIIAVAPVINSYEDWHYGGVPNGEGYLSPAVGYQGGFPVAYATGTAGTAQGGEIPDPPEDPPGFASHVASNLCDPTLAARANDPRFIYQDFYAERDFKQRADDVKAAVLYTQGFEDLNVKSQMIPSWFNEIQSPKLGLFGHWVHQHPPRADGELLMVAWMDQYVKGRDLGLEKLPNVDVLVDREMHRSADAWPTPGLPETTLYPVLHEDRLSTEPGDGAQVFLAAPADAEGAAPDAYGGANSRIYTMTLDEPLTLSGVATLQLEGVFSTAGNAYIAAGLYRQTEERTDLVTYGMYNLAHRDDHSTYTSYYAGEPVSVPLTFLPTEAIFDAGETIVLELRVTDPGDDAAAQNAVPATVTFEGGADGTRLILPDPGVDAYSMDPATIKP